MKRHPEYLEANKIIRQKNLNVSSRSAIIFALSYRAVNADVRVLVHVEMNDYCRSSVRSGTIAMYLMCLLLSQDVDELETLGKRNGLQFIKQLPI